MSSLPQLLVYEIFIDFYLSKLTSRVFSLANSKHDFLDNSEERISINWKYQGRNIQFFSDLGLRSDSPLWSVESRIGEWVGSENDKYTWCTY